MKKLQLKKEVISKMENDQMRQVKGGASELGVCHSGLYPATCFIYTYEFGCEVQTNFEDNTCNIDPNESVYDDLCHSQGYKCTSNGGVQDCIIYTVQWGINCAYL